MLVCSLHKIIKTYSRTVKSVFFIDFSITISSLKSNITIILIHNIIILLFIIGGTAFFS